MFRPSYHTKNCFIVLLLLTVTVVTKAQQVNSAVQPLRQFSKNYFSKINQTISKEISKNSLPEIEEKITLLKVQGNILYDFSYRSYIDTPFTQKGVIQHFAQASVNFLIQDKYPITMLLTNRSSNSPYFRNITNVNFQFNRNQLLNNIKERLKAQTAALVKESGLAELEQQYQNKWQQLQILQAWINDPARVQELVEQKEMELKKMIDDRGRAAKDSILSSVNAHLSSVSEQFNTRKAALNKLQTELQQYSSKINQLKKNIQDSINIIKRKISSFRNSADIFSFMKKNNIAKDELTKAQRLLLSVNQIGLGRSWVDYSELTVKSISLTGVNLEMNPSNFYVAFAAGKLNYRFRDFIVKNNTLPDQSLYLARVGVGKKEKNNLIVSFYSGKKSVLNYPVNVVKNALQRVMGISAEGKFSLNENNYIIAEIAKSSFNGNANTQLSSSELVKRVTDLKIHDNEAYSIKLFSQHPKTNTRFTGYYRKTGENFQSFNLYPINTNQEAWMAKINQQFWKKRIALEAAVRKNDFASPIAAPSFESQTVFKSLQASVSIPKFPFISVGYYPSSQLSLGNNDVLVENQYNTFNALVSHSYQFKNIGMNTNAVFTKFYNNNRDTGFLYFNAASYALNQSLFIKAFTLQSSACLTEQNQLNLLTLEQMLNYSFKNVITVGGSVKYNRFNHSETFFGGSGNISVTIQKIGTIQMSYDKSYLPGYDKKLVPVDMGRVSLFRSF